MQLNSELHVKYVCIMYMRKKHLKNADRFPKMSIFIAVDGRSHDLFACGPEFRLLLSRKVKSKRQNIVQKILKVHICITKLASKVPYDFANFWRNNNNNNKFLFFLSKQSPTVP